MGRVALADEVGALLYAHCWCIPDWRRPGLSAFDSMGILCHLGTTRLGSKRCTQHDTHFLLRTGIGFGSLRGYITLSVALGSLCQMPLKDGT
jgi:hypothetical protein